MYKDKKVIAIVLAAGSGSRMGFDKMLYKLNNKSVVSHSVSAFNSNDFIDEIVVTASTNIDEIKEQVNGYLKVTKVIQGGESRAKSVENALKYVTDNSIVAVHDGARPYVSDEVINNIIAAAYDYNAAIPCVPVKDTIKVSEDGFVLDTPNRSALNITQTPQAFNTDIYKKLLCNNNEDFTDDAQLFENAGYRVKIINGEYKNIKLTTKEDLVMKQNFRIGHGYDVHKLVENRKFILGGVTIPYEKGLLGHSDADVLLHSISDSLLGALALGDIGKHFPDTSSEYKGADSLQLLAKVMELIRQKGYAIGNVDATVICQQPKLAPHIPQMIKNIAKTLQCDESCVSVKATTEEKLGFTGSGEGVSAHCVCILQSDS